MVFFTGIILNGYIININFGLKFCKSTFKKIVLGLGFDFFFPSDWFWARFSHVTS